MIRTSLPCFIAGAALCAGALLNTACERHGETPGTPGADVKTSPTREPPSTPPVAPPGVRPANTATPSAAPPAAAPPTAGAGLGGSTPKSEYLEFSWARDHKSQAGAALTEAARLEALGHELYTKHQDAAAITQYEQALDAAATGSIYYKYGNSLSNVERLDDAIKAYDIAIELGYEHPEAVTYNTACALSRKGETNRAFDKLREAIAAGYAADRKLLTDPDLAKLRAEPDWPSRYAMLHPTLETLVGEYHVYGDRDTNDFYQLCPNNQVVGDTLSSLDGSCCQSNLYGTLRQQGHDFVVEWYEECGQVGKGKKQSTKNWPVVNCQPYASCSKEITCKASGTKTKPNKTKLFSDKDLLTQGRMAFPEDAMADDQFYVPSATPPKECAKAAEIAREYGPK